MPAYIGLDVHKRVAMVIREGGVYHERFPNNPGELRRFLSAHGSARIAVEATYCWQPVYELAES